MPATNQNNNTALRVQVDSRMSPALSSPLEFVTEIPRKEVHLLREFIGQGSYGTVVKGSWRGRYVAVKIYKTDEERESFAVEVKQLSRVNHPNIVKLYGASTQAELTYLVMEYAEGGSLNHLLHDAQHIEYDLRHAISWAMQMALGVAYLHDIRIMHRDLKPANLLLFASGTVVKICDFGTACVLRTQMTNNTGSASYMAPEVFEDSKYNEKGDVFSWAIILWEMLARKRPFHDGENPFSIMWAIHAGHRPRDLKDCPAPIKDLLNKGWDSSPAKRPSMNQVVEDIKFIHSLCISPDDDLKIDLSDVMRRADTFNNYNDNYYTDCPTNSTTQTAHSYMSAVSYELPDFLMMTPDQQYRAEQSHHNRPPAGLSVVNGSVASDLLRRQPLINNAYRAIDNQYQPLPPNTDDPESVEIFERHKRYCNELLVTRSRINLFQQRKAELENNDNRDLQVLDEYEKYKKEGLNLLKLRDNLVRQLRVTNRVSAHQNQSSVFQPVLSSPTHHQHHHSSHPHQSQPHLQLQQPQQRPHHQHLQQQLQQPRPLQIDTDRSPEENEWIILSLDSERKDET